MHDERFEEVMGLVTAVVGGILIMLVVMTANAMGITLD